MLHSRVSIPLPTGRPNPRACRRLMQSGVGSGSSGASVALCPMDGGSCSLAPPADAGGNLEADVVPVVTVDELLAMHQLQHADLLKVGGRRAGRD